LWGIVETSTTSELRIGDVAKFGNKPYLLSFEEIICVEKAAIIPITKKTIPSLGF
jgi:hypothetical protein